MRQKVGKPVFRVSTAPKSLKADVRSREIRYLVSMGVRTVCFVMAFVTHGTLRWLLIVAAFVLPYIAVVIANAGRERRSGTLPAFAPDHPRELPAGTDDTSQPQNTRGAV
jgi:Flp pilus assembly protein TadB